LLTKICFALNKVFFLRAIQEKLTCTKLRLNPSENTKWKKIVTGALFYIAARAISLLHFTAIG